MSAETDLLATLKAYELGYLANIQTARQNQAIVDPVLIQVLSSVSPAVPGASEAIQMAQKVVSGIQAATGEGSFASRLSSAIFGGNLLNDPIGTIKSLWSGRTFNSDQYYGASDYSFYVLGKDVGASTNVKDSDVIPAMKWYIDKLGIFISGSAHVNALRNGVSNYINMVKVNSYTTTDVTRVTAARAVVLNYMPYNYVPMQWRNAVGVYDNELVALAKAGYTNYQQDLQSLKQQSTGTITSSSVSSAFTNSNIVYGIVIAIIIFVIVLMIAKSSKK